MKNKAQETCKTKQSLYQAVLASATKYPNRIAFRYFNHAYKYKFLIKRINQFASYLTELGVKKDEPVTICLPNIPDAIYLLYAINQIGAIANIVHPLFTYEQLNETLEKTNCKYAFVLDTNYSKFEPLIKKGIHLFSCSPAKELSFFERFLYRNKNKAKLSKNAVNTNMFYKAKPISAFDDRYLNDSVYLHSGGTSGEPKTIALSSFAINSVSTNSFWILGTNYIKGMGILAVLPMFHGFGLCKCIHSFLSLGGTDVLMPKFSRKDCVKYIRKNQLHILVGVPVLYEAMLSKNSFRGRKLKHLRIAFVGGDYVSPALKERFDMRMQKAKSICRLREGYGLTEVVNVCSVNTFNEYKPGTVGKLLPNVKGIVIDEKGVELGFNQEGELCIGGDTIMNGYRFNKDEFANEKVFYLAKDGTKYIRTGDYGSIDEDRFITYKSRIKRLVKVNGVPVFPSMVEDCATSFNFVYETCAIGIEDEKHGHIIRLYIMLSKTYKGTKEEAQEKIIERIVSRLGVYSKPKEIIFLDKMPHTALGKIDYKALK